MSQTWESNLYTTGTEADTTLSNMELMFATLKSAFSGATAPASQVPGQIWFDTSKKACKQRNQGDTAWVGLMHGDTSQKIWVYRNTAMDGWAIDSSVTDRVLGLKGGSTYTTGAATAGSWTVSGLTNAAESTHTHTGPSHTHTATTGVPQTSGESGTDHWDDGDRTKHVHTLTTAAGGTGNTSAGTEHNHVISSDATWRAAAAVGTLQYLDL